MLENNFDEFFRNKLQDHSSPVPGHIWSRIRQKDKDRKALIFWRLFVLLVVCGLGSWGIVSLIHSHAAVPGTAAPAPQANRAPRAAIPSHLPASSSSSVPASLPAASPASSSDPAHISSLTPAPELSHPPFSFPPPDTPHPSVPAGATAPTPSAASHPSAPPAAQPAKSPLPSTTRHPSVPAAHRTSYPVTAPAPSTASRTNDSTRNRGWYASLYIAPVAPFDQLSSNDLPALQYARKVQQMRLSFAAGLTLTRTFGQHFSATAGILYTRINERFVPDSNLVSSYGHINSLDIPLLIGYEWAEHQSHRFGFQTGIVFNAYTWYKGPRYDPTALLFFKHHTGIGLYFGASLAQKINSRLEIFTEPYFIYRLNNMTTTGAEVSEKINLGGLALGVRYHFRKDNSSPITTSH